ncbi:protein kinase [Nonomuraea sp. NPDC050404]|uniref:serine/threonine-protein kinase n=1 Tax=Nonomuraea sp. NPDC050404 TaxID=3155783 RepID=UPI0033DA9EDD
MYGDGPWGVPGYTEVRQLGSGAAGRVVLAMRQYDGAEVAIKYLSDELRADVGFVARFRHEARLLATLQSAYHARLFDYVETGQGAAVIMELVNGVPLRQLLHAEGPTGPEAALVVLKGSLLGLASAHAIGVVHRDFKPENVMVRGDGTSKLVDFGIAVRVGDDAAVAGTPPYMAPEQWAGAPAGPATDVYAAAVVFFECLAGMRPYRAPNLAALARQHQSMPPPVEEVPEQLRGLVERGLAKDPGARPPSAQAFLTELEAVAAQEYGPEWEQRGRHRLAALAGKFVVLAPPPPDEPAEAQTVVTETGLRPPGRAVRLGTKVTAAAVGVLALVAAVVVILSSGATQQVLQAETTEVTPTPPTTSAAPVPEETIEEPLPTLEEEPTQEPTPTETTTSAPPPAAPTTARPTRRATPTPTRAPLRTRQPVPTRTATPTESEDDDSGLGGDTDDPIGQEPDAPPSSPTEVPTRTEVPTDPPTEPSNPPSTGSSPTGGGETGPTVPPQDPPGSGTPSH